MPNTSATGGYLLPTNSGPLEDVALQDFLHDWIVGITGLPANLVMPRWQPEPPNIPNTGVNWAAFGIINRARVGTPAIVHDPAGDGKDSIHRHESLHILISFYGPNSDHYELLFSQGIYISQNREVLQLANFGLIGCDEAIAVPEMIKEQWTYRVDLAVYLLRQIILDYAVENLLIGQGAIITESGSTTSFVAD